MEATKVLSKDTFTIRQMIFEGDWINDLHTNPPESCSTHIGGQELEFFGGTRNDASDKIGELRYC